MRTALIIAAFAQILLASAAFAQVRPVEAAPGDVRQKSAEAAKPAGPDSTTETFGDWSIVCTATAAGATERACEVDSTLTIRGQTAPFARIAFVRPARDKPARLIALVPVNVSIAAGVKIESDPGKMAVDLPFKSCIPAACIAEAELTKEQMLAFRGQAKGPGQMTLVDASGKQAALQVSQRGLDEALDAFFKRQEK